jgi:BlaI family transcriptional regulator, penicillinase repressor
MLSGGTVMPPPPLTALSRRERQIMEIVYRHGRITGNEIHQQMSDPPSYSTVRTLLRVLEQKGHLAHEYDGPRFVFFPCVSTEKAKRSALKQLLHTFFNNSAVGAMAALLDLSSSELDETELKQMTRLIQQAREKEKNHE